MRKGIVLVEDDPRDVQLISDVIAKSCPECSLEVFRDGMNALQFFRSYGTAAKHSQITVVLLDLKIPHLDGINLLREIKASELTRHLPVVVVTGAPNPDQIDQAYRMGANSVIEKAQSRGEGMKSLRSTLEYWLNNNLASQTQRAP